MRTTNPYQEKEHLFRNCKYETAWNVLCVQSWIVAAIEQLSYGNKTNAMDTYIKRN